MFHFEEFLVAEEVGLTLQSHPGEDIVNVYFIKHNNHYLGVPKLCKQRLIGCPGTLERIMSMLLPIIFSKSTWASSKTVSSSPPSRCVLENGNCEKNLA